MSLLLTPYKLGSLELSNRVVMAPLTRSRAGTSRMPNDYMRQYYEMRASAGLIIVEASAISSQGYGRFGAPGLYTDEHAKGWKPITDAVHKKGGKIFVQLWHMGRLSHPSFHDVDDVVAPSAIKITTEGHVRDAHDQPVPYVTPRALTTEEVEALPEQFRHSALIAKESGFDGVEIHAANGYLLDTFLQSSTNLRTDKYGGSPENRVRVLHEVIAAIAKVFPHDRIGVRISPNGVRSGMGSADNDTFFPFLAKEISHYGLAYLHVMDGLDFGFHNLCRRVTLFDIKKEFPGPIIGNVAYTKDTAEGALRTGAADLIAFGRPYLSNPDLVERFKDNLPLAEEAPFAHWYGHDADPSKTLEGYLTYGPAAR
eukprot:gene9050-9987_t